MKHQMLRIPITLLIIFLSQFANAADIENAFSNKLVNELFAALPGLWNGQAIETPVGPVGYAMNFHQCGEGVVAGVADTGASFHYWRFWKSDGALRLTFLSTFRGNREPTQLVPNKFEENTIWFYAPELALLTVSITLDESNIDIRVFHHRKPHVYIRLVRADKSLTESEHEDSLARSCKNISGS